MWRASKPASASAMYELISTTDRRACVKRGSTGTALLLVKVVPICNALGFSVLRIERAEACSRALTERAFSCVARHHNQRTKACEAESAMAPDSFSRASSSWRRGVASDSHRRARGRTRVSRRRIVGLLFETRAEVWDAVASLSVSDLSMWSIAVPSFSRTAAAWIAVLVRRENRPGVASCSSVSDNRCWLADRCLSALSMASKRSFTPDNRANFFPIAGDRVGTSSWRNHNTYRRMNYTTAGDFRCATTNHAPLGLPEWTPL